MQSEVKFTPAKFDTGSDMEKSIITSTGPYIVTWNFRRIKQGKLFDYTIRKYEEDVVADNFKYGMDRSIIVALPSNVEMVSKVDYTYLEIAVNSNETVKVASFHRQFPVLVDLFC